MKEHESWPRSDDNPFMDHNFVILTRREPDMAQVQLTMRTESKNPYGMAHGGALYTIADDVAGFAAHTDGRRYVTKSSAMNFLGNQREGTLTGTAQVRHRGRSTCLVEVSITNEAGKLLATGMFDFFCVGE